MGLQAGVLLISAVKSKLFTAGSSLRSLFTDFAEVSKSTKDIRMNWSTPEDLKKQILRLWERGELLRDMVTGNSRFPLRLTLKSPGSADVTERFDAVRAWSDALANAQTFRLEWREVKHRVQGRQRLPEAVWVDSLDDAFTWIGKRVTAERFSNLLDKTRQERPELLPWLVRKPLKALAAAKVWPGILAVVSWLMEHPRPGMYMRQVDIPGIDSKFIEKHCGILTELFDMALPPEAVMPMYTGISRFAARYGFLEKPVAVRFRVLDGSLSLLSGVRCPDMALDADSFSQLVIRPHCVFITENEINFLAFPQTANAIALFGAGYGWEALARSRWLHHCAIRYWGDIDTHGFAILNQLRAFFPHAESFLMDKATLEEHEAVWGEEGSPVFHELPRLTHGEQDLYDDLRYHRIRKNLRLEQEHIRFGWLQNYLSRHHSINSDSPDI
jgi:hypothetical protein